MSQSTDNLRHGNIQINSSHYDGKYSYIYKFPAPVTFKNAKVAVESLSIYNSTFNINTKFNNNVMSILWLGNTYNIIIPDGYYSIDQLNSFLQQQCLINNLYCTTNSGSNYVYFINLSANVVTYDIELDLFTIPTSTQASALGFTIASGATWSFPASATTPQLQINAGLQTLFGMTNQSLFPLTPQSTNQTFVSNGTPVISPVFCYVFACNLINTSLSSSPNLLYQLPLTAGFGELITTTQRSEYIDVSSATYSQITISLFDQNGSPLEINDPELSMVLNLKY